MIVFIAPYTFRNRDYRHLHSAIAYLHALQFTVTHAPGFSVSTSRILAMDLSVSLSLQTTHDVFFTQPNSFLAISSESHLTSISRTRPNSRQLPQMNYSSTELNFWQQLKRRPLSLYNSSARTTQKTRPLYCWEGMFTDPLPSNRSPTVERVGSRGNVFTESLPSNGYTRHNINMCPETFNLWVLVEMYIYNKYSKCPPWDSVHASTRLIWDRRIRAKMPGQLRIVWQASTVRW
jgi:hypothetical protein